MSYSIDLRERALSFIESTGKITEASRLFKVSRTVLYKWINMKETTGSVEDAPPVRGWKKIDPEVLEDLVSAHPDWILSDYAEHLGTSINAVWKAFKRLKITRKKRLYGIKNAMRSRDQFIWNKSKT